MKSPPITLGPELTIAQAAAARESLLAGLANAGDTLTLDLGAVEDFDSAGIQLLLAVRRSMTDRGGRLVVGGASATVRRHLELFGLDGLLADTAPASAAEVAA